MKYIEYIDDYFKGDDAPSQSRQFEQRLTDDPAFAEEVAFYLTTHKLLQEDARADKIERFRKLYQQQPAPVHVMRPVRKMWRYVAVAAAVVGLVFAINVLLLPPSRQALADRYIQQHLNILHGTTMSGSLDSLDLVRELYNKGAFSKAAELSEDIIHHNAADLQALEYAGVSNLQLKEYDKALNCFKQLASYKAHTNLGVFYQALTLLKRNQSGDLPLAKTLLEHVRDNNLTGNEIAREWLDKW